ncbi:MAG: nucleotide exchange factor GrpE [Flavobacteriales bacterium]|nr:nucleotide exchange factor GrpE [Flavobacteriales bacterium]
MSKKEKEEMQEELTEEKVEETVAEDQSEKDPEVEKDPLEELQTQYNQLNDKYLRLYSEFENFRRRTAKERLDLMKSAGEDVFILMLPVLDDFKRALENMKTAKDISSVKEGVELIYHKLDKELTNKGLKPMESKGEVFDSEFHEALTQIPAPSKKEKGKVVDVIEEGYFLNDKVIRFAKVVVGS